jgi:hypothetical protein
MSHMTGTRPAVFSAENASLADPSSVDTRLRILGWFVTIQLLSTIFLQKFALQVGGLPISLPMLILFISVGAMVLMGRAEISPGRLVAYLITAMFAIISQLLVPAISITSLGQFLLLYGCMVFCWDVPIAFYRKFTGQYLNYMILPAFIVLAQWTLSEAVGDTRIINMDAIVPADFLLSGYNYDHEFSFGSDATRPNGFFFLEPSYVSAFLAAAFALELTGNRRPVRLCLYVSAMVACFGATGPVMLAVVLPLLLRRLPAGLVIILAGAIIIGLSALIVYRVPLPFIDRLDELATPGSSGFERIMLPAQLFFEQVTNMSQLLYNLGAGSTTDASGGAWPLLKVCTEYSTLTMMSFSVFLILCFSTSNDRELKIGLFCIYNFTGAYLLSPIMVQFVLVLAALVYSSESARLVRD